MKINFKTMELVTVNDHCVMELDDYISNSEFDKLEGFVEFRDEWINPGDEVVVDFNGEKFLGVIAWTDYDNHIVAVHGEYDAEICDMSHVIAIKKNAIDSYHAVDVTPGSLVAMRNGNRGVVVAHDVAAGRFIVSMGGWHLVSIDPEDIEIVLSHAHNGIFIKDCYADIADEFDYEKARKEIDRKIETMYWEDND